MRYLIVDGMLSGSGIREAINGGWFELEDLGLSADLRSRIGAWLERTEDAHYREFPDDAENRSLDAEGLQIRDLVATQRSDDKVGYYSAARLKLLVQP